MKPVGATTAWMPRARGDRRACATSEIVFLRLPQVVAMCGLSRSSIYDAIKRRAFPGPVKINGGKCSVWPKHEVVQWMLDCLREQRTRQ